MREATPPAARDSTGDAVPAAPTLRRRIIEMLSFLKSIKYEAVVVLIVLAGVLTTDMTPRGPLRAGRDWLFDTYQRFYPARHDTSTVVVVEIDEESIERVGPWPWPRDKLAALVDDARGARAIGLDVLLPDHDRFSANYLVKALHVDAPGLRQSLLDLPDPDLVLARSLRALPTVLAMSSDEQEGGRPTAPLATTPVRERGNIDPEVLPHANSVWWPLPVLAEAAHGMGTVSAARATSGEIDRLPLVMEAGGSVLPSFGLELLAIALNAETLVLDASSGGVRSVLVGGLNIPTDPSGEVRPRFVGADRLVRIPAYRLLEQLADRSALRDRIVVIGVTARGVGETFRIPLGIQESSAAVHAELLTSALAGDTLSRPRWATLAESIVAVAAGLATILLLGRVRYRIYLAVFGSIVLILVGCSVLLFLSQGLLVDCVLPLTCLFAAGFVAISFRIRAEMVIRSRREAELVVTSVRRSAERREAELRSEAETLRQSLAFAVDAARLGVWDADLRSGTWRHSQRHDAVLGLPGSVPTWTPALLLDRVVPEDRAMVQNHLAVAETSGRLQLECRIKWLDGSIHHIHVLGRLWQDAGGNLSRSAGIVADITLQRELELRLRQGEKMQAIGLLAGGVAHNFNNLLTVVLGSLDMAQAKLDPYSRARPLIASAIASSRKCADIARQLLAFARLQPLQPKAVDPAGLLRDVHQMLGTALPERIQLHLDAPPHLGEINIDPVEFELAILNLAMNARDAMPNGGRLEIDASNRVLRNPRLGLDGRYLLVNVKDDGRGIAPEELPKVFEPFFTTKEVGKGTGLGLSQVHGFAHQSGGAVDIESTPGKGTCVHLYLPASEQTTQPARSVGAKISP
jgi:signal transduction histidine kinase